LRLKVCVVGFAVSLLLVFSSYQQHSIVEESLECAEVRSLVHKLYDRHVESLNSSQTFESYYSEIYDRGLYELLNRVDPFRVIYTQPEIQSFASLSKSPLFDWVDSPLTCDDYLKFTARAQKNLHKLSRQLIEVVDRTPVKNLEKLSKDFENYLTQKDVWPADNQQRLLLLKSLFASAFLEASEHEAHPEGQRRLAKRLFLRRFEDLHIRTQKELSNVVMKSVVATMDAHSRFFTDDEYTEAIRSLMSTFVGVGIVVAEVDRGYKVLELIEGGPAAEEGLLKVNDILIRVEEVSIAGERREVLAKLLAGPSGSLVNVTVLDGDGIRELDLTRGPVRTASSTIEYELKPVGGKLLGRIKLEHFYTDDRGVESSYSDFSGALKTLVQQGAEGLVIDLRDNGGGVLSEVVNIAGLFIDSGPIVFEYGTLKQGLSTYEDTDNTSLFRGPLVVLVNENSASAAEILAGVLKTYRRAVIVGSEQTYGKGTIQEIGPIQNISDSTSIGGGVKLTVGYYYLPNGESVQFDGVKPDIKVSDLDTSLELERNLPMALEKPVDIGLEFKPYTPWMNSKQFGNLVDFVSADQKAQKLLEIDAEGTQKDSPLNTAYQTLSGAVDYFKLYLPGLVAAKAEK
tara:strand:+ start:13688 stop:15568 length:1881 start_codon:yes stop_codon:yes gene_type:complete